MKESIAAAFRSICQNWSPDRVICDPELNAAFIAECRRLGRTESPEDLNRRLMNLRKQGSLRKLKSRRTSFRDEDQYRFAAEMAARFLERRDDVTLDDILCDPILAARFDEVATSICPGFLPLQYRWAALNLRKVKGLKPELLARVARPQPLWSRPLSKVQLSDLPVAAGLYVFHTSQKCLYVGEAENLRNRVAKHLDHSDNKGLARWMWDEGTDDMFLEIHVLDESHSTRIRKALELELIESRRAVFNIRR